MKQRLFNTKYFVMLGLIMALSSLIACGGGQTAEPAMPESTADTSAAAPTTTPPEVVQNTIEAPIGMANPASVYCGEQGGTLAIEKRGDGGEIGVCYFDDNRQCEEWALFRGECPVGGVRVTGYITEAGRYCAITGGTYAVTSGSTPEDEQGTCTFADGSVCDARDYYNGLCSQGENMGSSQTMPFTNNEAGFSLELPQDWTQTMLPDQNEGMIKGMSFNGVEGGVEVYWGVGFGGACPQGYEPVMLAQGEASACRDTTESGTEEWNQIGYIVEGGNDFSVRAFTNDAEPASRDVVLQVLSTLAFMPVSSTGMDIVPLVVEVCNGQAQAMAQFLNVLEVTQSEEPLTDFVNGKSGMGCMATVTGTGAQFESPMAVVETLAGMLTEQGYTEDQMLAAGGPTGMGAGFRLDNQLCMVSAGWEPDESANCPDDQPISACELTPDQQQYTITLNCGVAVP